MKSPARVLIVQVAAIAGVSAFLFFVGLGAFGLVGADEPRYAQIAREMFNRHDWIVPTLNSQPWLEKPVYLYWKIVNSYTFLGVSDWAARTPSAFHAVALVLVVFFFARRFRPGTETEAALIAASPAAMVAFSRGASTDMLLTSFFAAALLAWWTWHETGKKIWLAFFYALLAVGALTKGPVAPGLAVLVVGVYALLRGDRKIFVRSLWWFGFLLFFVITLPWYVAVQMKVPQFFRIFFLEHNLERFGTNAYHHSQPFWYYLPVFLLSMFPWTVFTLLAIVEAVRGRVWRAGTQSDSESRYSLFLLVWIVIPILFFSISRSKLPGYILPVVPAAALLTANYLPRNHDQPQRWTIRLHAVICGAVMGAAFLVPSRMLNIHPSPSVLIAVVVGGFVTAGLVLLLVRLAGTRALCVATLIPVIIILGFLLGPAAPVIDEANSARPVDARLRELGIGQEPIAVFNVKREVEYGLNFYRNEPVLRYQQDPIPETGHIVIAREGSADAVRKLVGQRKISLFGSFPPQHLEFFSVSKQ